MSCGEYSWQLTQMHDNSLNCKALALKPTRKKPSLYGLNLNYYPCYCAAYPVPSTVPLTSLIPLWVH